MLKDKLKALMPQKMRNLLRPAVKKSLILRASIIAQLPYQHIRPRFLIIGAQKCGTTSLFRHLGYHPTFRPPATKEIDYFWHNWQRGRSWYWANFPVKTNNSSIITGEATPDYLYHPSVPSRVQGLLPDIKLIIMLRNPVRRAISHYFHEVRLGHEHLPIADAIAAEPERLAQDRITTECPSGFGFNHYHYSYIDRGRYSIQLRRWFDLFPRQQILIVNSESFFGEPEKTYASILKFLELDEFSDFRAEHLLRGHYSPVDTNLARDIAAHFKEDEAQLRSLIDCDFNWKSSTSAKKN